MTPSPCGFADVDWIGLLEGTLDTASVHRAMRHIDRCGSCSAQYRELQSWSTLLARESERLRASLTMSEADTDRLLNGMLAQLRRDSEPRPPRQALLMVHLLLEPFCGMGTARASVSLAVRRSTSLREPDLNGRNWPVFVSNLSDTLASVCGIAAARLARRAGSLLVVSA